VIARNPFEQGCKAADGFELAEFREIHEVSLVSLIGFNTVT
jgi:hypothetical protein